MRVRIGEISIDALSLEDAVRAVEGLVDAGRGGTVFTPNVDHVVKAEREPEFRSAYGQANLVLADGAPLVWASRLLGTRLPERVAGSDLVLPLAELAARRGYRLYLLGGAPGDAGRAAEVLRAAGVLVVGVEAPRIDLGPEGAPDALAAAERVSAARPHLVYVALGAPKQEIWAERHRTVFAPAVAIGVGASLAFIAGTQPRAPRWMSRAGLEWLHRLSREPRRLWRRYLVEDPRFVSILARSMLRRRRDAAA
jgi:N-acetylglucosaminyldiphosphoundecaprenol N-acetyl-beta-D-mannosaminyltransferase